MNKEKKLTEEQLFDQLIASVVHSAWISLGKIKNPVTDQLEKDLDRASIHIDMLDMIYKRMDGNLTENEETYLSHLLHELKMNFIEAKKEKTNKKDKNSD